MCKFTFRTFCLISMAIVLLSANFSAHAQQPTSTRNRRADAPSAEATITVNEQFLNSFLTAIFDNLNEPSMPLTVGGATSTRDCASEIKLKREVSGTSTAVHFENNRIVGQLAFAGAYNSTLMGCIEFSGWADAEVRLDFDHRAVVAHFHLLAIHLNDAPAALNGPLLSVVQNAIDRRYNPVELFTLEQLSTLVKIQPAGGALRLQAKDVRPEITTTALALHIIYEFVKA